MKTYKLYYLVALILSTLTTCEEGHSSINSPVIEIGNKLAEWGDANCNIIAINAKKVLWQGPNSGGCSPVYFEYRTEDRKSFFDFKALEKEFKQSGASQEFIDAEI
jgi:hypothetical protein